MGKKTMYLAKESEEILNRGGKPNNFSARLNSLIMRYDGIVTASTPELSVGEWLCIMDANNGTWLEADGKRGDIAARGVWLNVADSELDGLAEKWDVDLQALSNKLREMPYHKKVAVVEMIQRFWGGGQRNNDEDYEALLRRIGAIK